MLEYHKNQVNEESADFLVLFIGYSFQLFPMMLV